MDDSDKTNCGDVVSVTAAPGRVDYFRVEYTWRGTSLSAQFSFEPIALVTVDDVAVSPGELVNWLVRTAGATVELHPCEERYGLSLSTEFRSPRST